MLKDLGKREKYLLMLLAVILVFYCYYSLLMLPILNSIDAYKSNIDKYNSEINSQVLNDIVVKKDKKQLEELKTNIEKSLSAFPQDERNPEVAYNIKAISNSCNVSLSAINFGQAVEFNLQQAPKLSNKVMSVPITLQISGDYKSIMNFISAIENDSRVAVIGTVVINGTGDSLQCSINVNYLYLLNQNMVETK